MYNLIEHVFITWSGYYPGRTSRQVRWGPSSSGGPSGGLCVFVWHILGHVHESFWRIAVWVVLVTVILCSVCSGVRSQTELWSWDKVGALAWRLDYRNRQSRTLCLLGFSWGRILTQSLLTAEDGEQGALSLCIPWELQRRGAQRQQQWRRWEWRTGQHLRVQHLPGHSQGCRHQPVRPPFLVSTPATTPNNTLPDKRACGSGQLWSRKFPTHFGSWCTQAQEVGDLGSHPSYAVDELVTLGTSCPLSGLCPHL